MEKVKKLLTKELKRSFENHIFERGRQYYAYNNVKKIKAMIQGKNKVYIQGEVKGSDYYFCNFTFDLRTGRFDDLNCDCPYGDDCKHLAALGLKFIDLYDEFIDKSGATIGDKDIRDGLVKYINSGKIIIKEKGADRAEVIIKDAVKDNQSKVAEGEFEEVSAEDLLRKTFEKIGLNAENIPKDIINSLADEIRKSKSVSSDAPEKKEAEKNILNKFNPEEYKVVIDFDYTFQIGIYKIRSQYNTISPNKFLKGDFEITEEQKEFFEFLKKYNAASWQEKQNLDYGKLFLLIKKSGIPVFIKHNYHDSKRMNFIGDKKIKAELILEKRENLHYNYEEHKFIFRLGEEYIMDRYENKRKFLIADRHIVYINDCDVLICEIAQNIKNIILRIKAGNEYYRDSVRETILAETEICDLNKIIEDCKKYLDLKTELEPNYNIQKFDRSDPCVVVDFNEKDAALEIKAAIDYGFTHQDVSQTVYYARMKTGKNDFKRREYRNQKKFVTHIDDKNIFYAPAEEKKEIDLFKSFYENESAGFNRILRCHRNGEEAILSFFEAHWPNIKETAQKNNYKIIFPRDEFNFAAGDFKVDLELDLNAAKDLLWFDAECYCGEDKIGLEDLKRYAEDKKGFLKTGDGRILKITNFEELEKFIMMLESFYARGNGGFEGKLYHATELEYIFTSSKYYNAKMAKSFTSFIKEAQSGKPVEKVKIPSKFNKILRDYQKEGINWFYFLRKYHFAGILADDMGLGKTLQSLVLLEKEKIEGKPSAVICPKTLLYNWKSEAEKFTPDIRALVIDGNPAERLLKIKDVKKYDLIITGYATMKKDSEIYKKNKIKFNYCILDEAQFIKNHATKNAQIVKKVDADYRLALTGTPLENSVSEIWSIFDFLMPGFLGSNRAFVKKFEKPIMKENNAAALNNLRKKIECFMLRRTKKEVLKELPPKIEQISNCHLEPAQNILYQEILASVKKEIFETVKDKGFNKSRIHILAGLTKLRQVCNHPALLLKEKKYGKYESAKLNMFLELLDEIIGNNRKVLVFSQFTTMLDILAEELKKNKIKYNYLSGKTRARQEVVKDFNENENKKVFLISLKAGGTGLNLTSADNVIIFDPWWNPSVENQAIDRTHRIGQKNSVNVYRLITAGTIEEKIMKLKEKKKFLFDSLVGESKDLFNKLTWDDIKELFR